MSQVSPIVFNNKFSWIGGVCGSIFMDAERIGRIIPGHYNNLANLLLYYRKERESILPRYLYKNKKAAQQIYSFSSWKKQSEKVAQQIEKNKSAIARIDFGIFIVGGRIGPISMNFGRIGARSGLQSISQFSWFVKYIHKNYTKSTQNKIYSEPL